MMSRGLVAETVTVATHLKTEAVNILDNEALEERGRGDDDDEDVRVALVAGAVTLEYSHMVTDGVTNLLDILAKTDRFCLKITAAGTSS